MDATVNYLFEMANIAYAAMILAIFRKRFNIEDRAFLLLTAHLIFILLANYVLFPPSYMSDQFTYLFNTQYFRGQDVLVSHTASRIQAASQFFAYFPIPLINSVYSIAIINFLLYFFLYIFLREKGILTPSNELFYFLYPSLALYTAVALRDTLIFVLMALFLYFFFVRRPRNILIYIFPVLFLVFLFLLKFQNALVVALAAVIFILFNKNVSKSLKFVIILLAVVGFYFFQSMFTLENINKIRFLFFLENNTSFIGFAPFTSWNDALQTALSSLVPYLLEPYIWKVKNPLFLVQSIENIVIFIMLVHTIIKNKNNENSAARISLIFLLAVGMLIYSMVIINPGTAARYRYPFIAVFFIYYNYFFKARTKIALVGQQFHKKLRRITLT